MCSLSKVLNHGNPHGTRLAQTSLQLFQLRGKVFVLLQEQRNASFWPRPPTNAWLYAGVVTSSAHLGALTTYASTHAIPILAIVGRALLQTEHRANCIEWPLPPDPKKPSTCLFLTTCAAWVPQDVLQRTCAC